MRVLRGQAPRYDAELVSIGVELGSCEIAGQQLDLEATCFQFLGRVAPNTPRSPPR